MKFFSVDGGLYKFITRFWDLVKLNFLWLICSLPVVTLGVSTIAAYTVTLKMVNEQEGYVARDFFRAFKSNLKQGMIMSPITILLFASVSCYFILGRTSVMFFAMGLIAAFVFALSLLFTFPLLARYENTIYKTMRNSLRISFKFFPKTLGLVAIIALEVVVIIFNEITLIVGAFIGPAFIMLTISGFAMSNFREIEKDGGAVKPQEQVEEDSESALEENKNGR